MQSPEQNIEVLVNVDTNLEWLEKEWESYVENVDRIHETCQKLDGKQTFVATKLIESSCMINGEARKMILAFDENNLPPSLS